MLKKRATVSLSGMSTFPCHSCSERANFICKSCLSRTRRNLRFFKSCGIIRYPVCQELPIVKLSDSSYLEYWAYFKTKEWFKCWQRFIKLQCLSPVTSWEVFQLLFKHNCEDHIYTRIFLKLQELPTSVTSRLTLSKSFNATSFSPFRSTMQPVCALLDSVQL